MKAVESCNFKWHLSLLCVSPPVLPYIRVRCMVLSNKYLPASSAVADFVQCTVWFIRKETCVTNSRALRWKVVVSREALKRRRCLSWDLQCAENQWNTFQPEQQDTGRGLGKGLARVGRKPVSKSEAKAWGTVAQNTGPSMSRSAS